MTSTKDLEKKLRQILVNYKVSTAGESMGLDEAVEAITKLFQSEMEELKERMKVYHKEDVWFWKQIAKEYEKLFKSTEKENKKLRRRAKI